MKTFEEFMTEATANKQLTVSLDADKRELTFNLKGLFPTALISAMGKALKGGKFTIEKDEFKVYL